jgi:hypothetical protein
MNKKKLWRLYREEAWQCAAGAAASATGTRAPMALPDGPNRRWSPDFVSDTLSWGRRGHHAAMPYAGVPAFIAELRKRQAVATLAPD